MVTSLSKEEFMALSEIAKARRELLTTMFAGTQLKFGTMSKLKTGKNVLSSGKKIARSGKKLASGGSSPALQKVAQEFMKTCADVDGIEDIIQAISMEAFGTLMREVTPYFGVLSSGYSAGKAGKHVVKDGMHLYKFESYKTGFLGGDPVAAAEAVHGIIKRDLARHSIDFARQSAACGTKIAGLFGDLGTASTAAIGLANAIAGLGLELYALGIEIKTMKAGNKRLAQPNTLDLTVFEDCPLLGCYMLTCADTSSVANFFVADIGLPGWMDKVETLKKKKMDPLLKIAGKDIEKSRLQLEGLSSNKGTHMDPSFFAKKKSKYTNWRLKKNLDIGDRIQGQGSTT